MNQNICIGNIGTIKSSKNTCIYTFYKGAKKTQFCGKNVLRLTNFVKLIIL